MQVSPTGFGRRVSRGSSMPVRIVQLAYFLKVLISFKSLGKKHCTSLFFSSGSKIFLEKNTKCSMDLLQKVYLYSFCNPLKIFLYHLEPFRSYFLEVTIWLENKIESLECKYTVSNTLAIWNYSISEVWVQIMKSLPSKGYIWKCIWAYKFISSIRLRKVQTVNWSMLIFSFKDKRCLH